MGEFSERPARFTELTMTKTAKLNEKLLTHVFNWKLFGSFAGCCMYRGHYHGSNVQLEIVTNREGQHYQFYRGRKGRGKRWTLYPSAQELLDSFPKLAD